MDFHELPEHYAKDQVHRQELINDPFKQFIAWMDEAKENQIEELNAMSLATSTSDGAPSCRMVLLKHFDQNGLIFYTNYNSRKSQELAQNPRASAVIFWPKLMRQICVEGKVEKVSKRDSENYFHLRQRESQIAAWASEQGNPLSSREELLSRCIEISKKYQGKEVPLPPFWGGFRLIPNRFEFWQGGPHRLHDRFQYLLHEGCWKLSRLYP